MTPNTRDCSRESCIRDASSRHGRAETVGVGEATFDVLVAPMEWLDRQNVVFRMGEKLEIVGSRQNPAVPNTFIAREIRTPGQTVVLRDNNGKALWN